MRSERFAVRDDVGPGVLLFARGGHPSDCCFSVSYADEAVESARSSARLTDLPVRQLTNRHAFLGQVFNRASRR